MLGVAAFLYVLEMTQDYEHEALWLQVSLYTEIVCLGG